MMAKPSSFHCNIKCEYCFYLQKEQVFTRHINSMTEQTLENYIKNYIDSFPGERIDFMWQGGEPTLLGLDFLGKWLVYKQNLLELNKLVIVFKLMGWL